MAMIAAHSSTTAIFGTRDTLHTMMLPLTEPEGGRITIDLSYHGALNFCANAPDAVEDSKDSFLLKLTIPLQPKTLPVRDEIAVAFCNEVRTAGEVQESVTSLSPSNSENRSSSRTSTLSQGSDSMISSQASVIRSTSTATSMSDPPNLITPHEAPALWYPLRPQISNTFSVPRTTTLHPRMEGVHNAL